MANITEEKQLEIYEIHTDDGGVGLQIGDVIYMGYSRAALMRLLAQIFTGGKDHPSIIDADLYNLAHVYLDGGDAYTERLERLRM